MQVFGGQTQFLRRFLSEFPALPKDPGAAFRTDDRIVSVLQYRDAVTNANADRAAGWLDGADP